MLLNLILFCFATIGMTNIIVDSSLFSPVRDLLQKILHPKLYELFECHQCCGTWCGILCGYILISGSFPIILLCGCAGSFLSSTHYLVTELILSKTDFNIDVTGEQNETSTRI